MPEDRLRQITDRRLSVLRQSHVFESPAGKALRDNAEDKKREQDNREGIVHDRVGQPLLPGPLFTFQVRVAARPRQFPGSVGGSRSAVLLFTVG